MCPSVRPSALKSVNLSYRSASVFRVYLNTLCPFHWSPYVTYVYKYNCRAGNSIILDEGDTPPFWYAVFRGGFRRYAVRKGSVRSTQKFCYIVRRHQFFTLKRSNVHQKHNTHDIQSQITLKKIACSLRSRFLGGHFSIYELKHGFAEVKI